MILEKESFRIKKITKADGVWNLYPKGKEVPIKLPVDSVYGELPPVRKWPWQCHDLTIKRVAGEYIVYAEMDGLVLFDLPEDKYPEEVKEAVHRIEKIESDYAAYQKQHADSIREQLQKLLPQLPKIDELEDEINKLPVCWRAYLKMRLPMQYESNEARQRLVLTLLLVQIANRIYTRHVDADEPLTVAFSSLEFSVCDRLSDLLDCGLADEFDNNPEQRNKRVFMFYNETKQELERVLPTLERTLCLYLVQQIHRMLSAYSSDYATLVLHRPRDLWGDTINTDSQAYRYLCKEMKLPLLSSLIIEKQFSPEDVEHFNFVF
jgi:hypothetical protein